MMSITENPQPTAEEAFQLVELIDRVMATQRFGELAECVLPGVAKMTHSSEVILYIADPRLPKPRFFQQGFTSEAASEVEDLCAKQFHQNSKQPDPQSCIVATSSVLKTAANLILYPLQTNENWLGLVGLTVDKEMTTTSPKVLEMFCHSLSNVISRLAEHIDSEKQCLHLNTYMTVSSMLVQSLDIHELLEMALQCCMDAVSAEAASVLLLDEEKQNFKFYQAEGPAKPLLMAETFPADKGVAGSILQTQQAEIINDVSNDPRFYKRVDSESGFETRNMIAIPLTAGEELVGVLEVLNKINGGSFTEEERFLLVSIAEEIAFAVRNAIVFEYVVSTYCKQRQGQTSCKGCKRPLGSWTPCIKYREANGTLQSFSDV